MGCHRGSSHDSANNLTSTEPNGAMGCRQPGSDIGDWLPGTRTLIDGSEHGSMARRDRNATIHCRLVPPES